MEAITGKLVFVVEEFAPGTPSQQLLDRLLIGYPRAGAFHRPGFDLISICLPSDAENPEIARRVKDFRLVREADLDAAMADAYAVVVVWKGDGVEANENLLLRVVQTAPRRAAFFVHGALAKKANAARELVRFAEMRDIRLCAGTSTTVTYRLPENDLKSGTRLREAMIVVQGAFPLAELDALEGLLPLIERRRKGEAGVSKVRLLTGHEVWRAGREGDWSWSLLASAISRSNTVQGDPVKDGRTQDIVGQGLIEALAKEPRAWLLDHRDGLRTTLLVLDGAVADFNFAVRAADGTVTSAQLYRPPRPGQEQFSRLAAVIEDFFRTGKAPWAIERSLLTAELLEGFRRQHGAP